MGRGVFFSHLSGGGGSEKNASHSSLRKISGTAPILNLVWELYEISDYSACLHNVIGSYGYGLYLWSSWDGRNTMRVMELGEL